MSELDCLPPWAARPVEIDRPEPDRPTDPSPLTNLSPLSARRRARARSATSSQSGTVDATVAPQAVRPVDVRRAPRGRLAAMAAACLLLVAAVGAAGYRLSVAGRGDAGIAEIRSEVADSGTATPIDGAVAD
ncbi:MAG: hypothetical protein ACR2QK_19930 [Acidimicrobiales bacterium]